MNLASCLKLTVLLKFDIIRVPLILLWEWYKIAYITAILYLTATLFCFSELPFVTMVASYIGQSGHSLTLRCNIESLVPISVRWFKDGASKSRTLKYKYVWTTCYFLLQECLYFVYIICVYIDPLDILTRV